MSLKRLFATPSACFIILACLSTVSFTAASLRLNRHEIWFSNLDQDSTLLLNSLRTNDGRPPDFFGHPSQGVFILYGGLFRVFHRLGASPISRFSDLEGAPDPLSLVPDIFYSGRVMSIVVSLLCVAMAAAAIYIHTRRLEYAALGWAFLLASPGLLLQSLLIRSELGSVFFLSLTMLLLAWFLKSRRAGLVFVIGTTFGLAYATKIQVLPFAAAILSLIVIALDADRNEPAPTDARAWLTATLRWGVALTQIMVTSGVLFVLLHWSRPLFAAHAVYQTLIRLGIPARAISIGFVLVPLALTAGWTAMKRRPRYDAGWLAARQDSWTVSWTVSWKRAMKVAVLLVPGFFFGVICAMALCSALGDLSAVSQTNARLFSYGSMTEYSTSGQELLTAAPSFLGSIKTVVREFLKFLSVYAFSNFILSGYAVVLLVTWRLRDASRRFIWTSLSVCAIGVLLMFVSSLRYYGEHYWIYADFFFMAAWAFLAFALIERFDTVRIRVAAAVVVGLLSVIAYSRVAAIYPFYNPGYRDRLDKASVAMFEVGDYSALMEQRYGDNLQFMRRVLRDPGLNGSNRGIDLRAKPGVQKVMAANPALKVDGSIEKSDFRLGLQP